jgi:hypothetical protein
MSLTFSAQSDILLTSTTEFNMIHHNAFYMFLINTGIVLMTAFLLDQWASYTQPKRKKNKRTKNVLDESK